MLYVLVEDFVGAFHFAFAESEVLLGEVAQPLHFDVFKIELFDSGFGYQGRRPKKPWYPPWEKNTVDEEEIMKLIEKSMKNKPKKYRRTVRGLSEI